LSRSACVWCGPYGPAPVGVLGQAFVTVAHAVRFDVGLVHDIEAAFVAELVPARIIGIVAGPDGVDVVLFHPRQVFPHRFLGNDVGRERVVLVAVDAFQVDRDAVDEQAAVLDLDLAEADFAAGGLEDLAGAVFKGQNKAVEIGRLGRPFFRGGQTPSKTAAPLSLPFMSTALAVLERTVLPEALKASSRRWRGWPAGRDRVLEIDGHVQLPVRVLIVQRGVGQKSRMWSFGAAVR